MKRTLDLAISVITLIILTPLLLIIALFSYYNLGRPILFLQKRVGLNSKTFTMIKFRTMNEKKDNAGNYLPDESRITKWGKFLRLTSLDELPELINVIKGEMSLVGPRPLLLEYLSLYSTFELRRHEVKPGITGWAQVNGRNKSTWRERFELDVWYVDNQSVYLDFFILIKTIYIVFTREGTNPATPYKG